MNARPRRLSIRRNSYWYCGGWLLERESECSGVRSSCHVESHMVTSNRRAQPQVPRAARLGPRARAPHRPGPSRGRGTRASGLSQPVPPAVRDRAPSRAREYCTPARASGTRAEPTSRASPNIIHPRRVAVEYGRPASPRPPRPQFAIAPHFPARETCPLTCAPAVRSSPPTGSTCAPLRR